MRTAEVTIGIIPEGLLDRPRHLETELSKTTSTVSLPLASSVLLVVDYYNNRMESIHEVSVFRHAVRQVCRTHCCTWWYWYTDEQILQAPRRRLSFLDLK